MKLTILRFLTKLALKHKVYYWWSKVYRWLWERRYYRQPMPAFITLDTIELTVGRMKWRKDGFIHLWDAISDPRATWYRHLKGKEAGDCDDISLFAVHCLRDLSNMRRRGNVKDYIDGLGLVRSFGVMSVPWVDKRGKTGGHNVGVLQVFRRGRWEWAHISNWYGGKVQLGFATVRSMARSILRGRTSLGVAIASPELKLIEWRYPEEIG